MYRPANSLMLLVLIFILSCQHKLKTEIEDTSYWNSKFIDSSYRLLYKDTDTTRALKYFDSSLSQSDKVTVYPKAARFGLIANYYYFFTLDNEATGRMIDSVLALYKTSELQDHYPRTYVGYLLFGGQIAYRLSLYSKANEYYFKAKKLADSHLNPCERKAFNYSIAMVLYQQQNYSASLRHFKEAYALQSTCTPQNAAIILQQQEIQSNIGLCLLQLKRYDSAMIHFDKALQIANSYKDSLGAVSMAKISGVIYGNKAKIFLAQNRLEEAELMSKRSIALNDRPGYEIEDALKVKLQLAEVYSRKKDYVSMSSVLYSLKDIGSQSNQQVQLEWKRLMASFYEHTSKPDLALQFFREYTLLKDSIAIVQKQLNDADVARQLAEKEQERQIATLKKDKHLALIYLWVTVLISCMVIIILYLIYQNYRRSKKNLTISLALNQEIKRQKEAREEEAKQHHKKITEAVITAQESERSLIGLELHDNINQVLTTVKLLHEMILAGVGDAKLLLPRASQYLQDCINEIRSLSKRLSAPTLGKISLGESVEDLIDSINQTSKVKITSHISGLNNHLLKKDLHIGVYRILQEQLNNVLKHAEASEVLVQLEIIDDKVHLCIKDNGRGFVVQDKRRGIGLMNMQTRAENLNGTFRLESKPGFGCKVDVVVPCVS
jgi:signal transduction histidine kinase